MSYEKFDAVIIDAELDARMRLKQAMTAVSTFGKVAYCGNLKEALAKLDGEDSCDVIFLSYQFEHAAIAEFIKAAKASKRGQDSAYVLVFRSKSRDNSQVSGTVSLGADGFLFEPYSIDELVEITQLAARLRKERPAAREAMALKYLVRDLIRHLDLLSKLKASGFESNHTEQKFRTLCSRISELSDETRQVYYKLAIDSFTMVPIPNRDKHGRKQYEGISQRVRQRMERKLLEELEKEAAAEAESGMPEASAN